MLERNWQKEFEALSRYVQKLEDALALAYTALTDGMADVPANERDPKCARLRVEAKREIRRVMIDNRSGES